MSPGQCGDNATAKGHFIIRAAAASTLIDALYWPLRDTTGLTVVFDVTPL